MTTRRPRSLLVGTVRFHVSYEPSDKMQGLYGQTRASSALIRINTGCALDHQRSTLLHESLHAISAVYGPHHVRELRNYLRRGKHRPDSVEEMFVAYLEPGLMALVRDNPAAWRWIMEG